jgi:hypothetical protein
MTLAVSQRVRFTSNLLAVAALALALSVALPGQAQPEEQLDRTHVWYGWQTLVADSLSIGTIALGASVESGSALIALGVVSVLATPAIIHAAHGNWLLMGVSLTLRVGGAALLMVGLIQAFSSIDWNSDAENPPSDDGPSGTVPMVLGALMLFAAPIVDAVLAFEKRAPERRSAWAVRPWASARDRSAGMSFVATF